MSAPETLRASMKRAHKVLDTGFMDIQRACLSRLTFRELHRVASMEGIRHCDVACARDKGKLVERIAYERMRRERRKR